MDHYSNIYFAKQAKTLELFTIFRLVNLASIIVVGGGLWWFWENPTVQVEGPAAVFIPMIPSVLFQILPSIRFNPLFRLVVWFYDVLFFIFVMGALSLIIQQWDYNSGLTDFLSALSIIGPNILMNGTLSLAMNYSVKPPQVQYVMIPQAHQRMQKLMV
ncbi:unnamed protein product [Moneuplotes crassus]|uniref:Uncharacterized protein n=1 Tax=Euplotes crassus TaxID=5936 RepID=A0AAD2D618_EUPCR|nr:unnamed protein product [Moneuplotes crassus]